MNKIDRYKILIRHVVNSGIALNQKDFGRKLGYTNESSFSQIINGKVNEPKDFILRLTNILPDLNSDWITSGEGEMLKDPTPPKVSLAPHYENVFSRSTDPEILEDISEKFASHLVEMYESGRAYPAFYVEKIKEELAEANKKIAALEAEIASLKNK